MISTGPLLFNEDVPADASVTVCADVERALVELAVHGRWSRRLQVAATHAISKCFAEGPRAVIVDLSDLGDPVAASAATWWTAAMHGAEQEPAVQVALSVPAAAALAIRLRRLGAKHYLPVYASMAEARTAVDSQLPLTERHHLRLSPSAEAATAAREAVDAVCAAWSLPALRFPGRLVISELLDNAFTHANTKITVTLTRRGDGLHLAVCDGDPRLPRLVDPASSSPQARWGPGLGLRTVHQIVTIWGAMPTATGKVVWAHLHRPSGLASERVRPASRTRIIL